MSEPTEDLPAEDPADDVVTGASPGELFTDAADQAAGEIKQEALDEDLARAAEKTPQGGVATQLDRIEAKLDELLARP